MESTDTPAVSSADSFDQLESKIRQAVDVVSRLRQERENAELEAKTAREDRLAAVRKLEQAESRIEELTDELDALRKERNQIRERIERLLGQIEMLGAG